MHACVCGGYHGVGVEYLSVNLSILPFQHSLDEKQKLISLIYLGCTDH